MNPCCWLTKQISHLGRLAFLQEYASCSCLPHEGRLSGSPKKKPILCDGDLREGSFSQVLPRKGCHICRPHGATSVPGETGKGKPGPASLVPPPQEEQSLACHSSPGQPEFSTYTHVPELPGSICAP